MNKSSQRDNIGLSAIRFKFYDIRVLQKITINLDKDFLAKKFNKGKPYQIESLIYDNYSNQKIQKTVDILKRE